MTCVLLVLLLTNPPLPSGSPFLFSDFPSTVETIESPPAPRLSSARARRYRTILREASTKAPDFAGHYRIVTWGCGTCCREFAVLDLKTGEAWFPPFFNACSYPPANIRNADLDGALLYRADSQLFVAVGADNERDWGTYYYQWNGRRLDSLAQPKDAGRNR